MVAAVAVLLCCVSGFGFYSLAVYVHALTTGDGPFSLAVVSRATSLYLLSTGLAGVGAAALLARRDARLVLASAAPSSWRSGLALVGRVSEPWQLYGAYVLLGLGQAGAGLVPGTTVVARWFVVRRGPAMALASTGLSVGGIAVAPLVACSWRATRCRPSPRSRPASSWSCACSRRRPSCPTRRRAVWPRTAATSRPCRVEPDGVTRAVAVRSRVFWGISAAQTLAVLAQVGGLTHLYSLVAERDHRVARQASRCRAWRRAASAGRFLGGLVLGRLSASAFFRLLLVLQAASLLTLAAGTGPRLLLGAALLFGLTIGNVLLVHPLLLAEVFGLRDFARVLSLSGLVATAGVTSGPLVVGLLRDATGSYLPGYLAAGSASLLGAGVLHLTFLRRTAASRPVALGPSPAGHLADVG